MKFIKSLFLVASLVFVVFKIFEDAAYESKKTVEKITIDFDPQTGTSTSSAQAVKTQTRDNPLVDSAVDEEDDVSDELLNTLEAAPKTERKEMIEDLSEKLHAGENILTARQKKIIDVLNANGKIDTSLLQKEIPKVTIRTLRRDLDALGKMGIIKKNGTTKGSFYVRA